jgi:hypothetical protein
MKLIAIHDAVGRISTLLTLPPNSPLGEVETGAGQFTTELEISEMKFDFNAPEIQNHLAEIIENYLVECEPQRDTLGRLVRRTASEDTGGVKEMNTEQTGQQSLHISQEKLLALVRAMIGGSTGREDDEHPLPPGPWDPHIRVALERINVFGPRPEPWKVIFASILARHPEIWDAIGGGRSFGDEVALNPQPLPPRFAFLVSLAQTVISRAELLQEIADATRREGEQQGIIIVSGYIARLVDDICGNDFRFRWPFPWPRPNWLAEEVSGIDLVVVATQFHQAANETLNPELRQNLADASAQLVEAGLSKMQ